MTIFEGSEQTQRRQGRERIPVKDFAPFRAMAAHANRPPPFMILHVRQEDGVAHRQYKPDQGVKFSAGDLLPDAHDPLAVSVFAWGPVMEGAASLTHGTAASNYRRCCSCADRVRPHRRQRAPTAMIALYGAASRTTTC